MMNRTADLEAPTPRLALPHSIPALLYLVPLAVVLAAAGQYVLLRARVDLPAEGLLQAIGGVLLLVGALLFGIALRQPLPVVAEQLIDPAPPASASPRVLGLPWLLLVIASILAAIAASALFAQRGETPVVVWLWLFSILLLLASQFRGTRAHWPEIARGEWPYWAALLVLLVLVGVTRSYHLSTLPYNVDGDFAEVGNQARALATGQQQHIFAYGWASMPILGYLPPWVTMLSFGTGLVGLNASGVVEGLLIILGVFLLGRELFSARAGLLSAALLAASYIDLAASRQSVYIDPAFFMLFATYFLVVGLKRARGWAVVASGIMTALCIQMYYAGRLIIPFAALALLYGLLFGLSWVLTHWKPLLIWLTAVLLTLGPMLLVFALSPETVGSRTQEVFILSPASVTHMQGVFGVHTISDLLLQQARHTILLFNYYPDKGTQFGLQVPYLDPYAGVLFVLGLGFLALTWKRIGAWLVLCWILLGIVLGSFLTINPPFWPRLIVLLPPVGLVCGVALDQLYGLLQRILGARSLMAHIALPLVVSLGILILGIADWNVYVAEKGTFALPRTRIARYLEDQPPTARAYLVSKGFTYRDREFNFLVPGRLVGNLTPEQALAPIPSAGSPTLLIVTTEEGDLVQQLGQRYPGGPQPGNSPGEIAFYVFQLP